LELKPSFTSFKRMSEQGNLIPVYGEFLCDTETPVSAYLKIREKSFSYLLESAHQEKKWGRYSFIGYDPFLTVLSRNRRVDILKKEERKVLTDVRDPMEVLRKLARTFKPVTLEELPLFQGGMVGYFNYDLVRKWERLPGVCPEDAMAPESVLTVSRRLIIFDHFTHLLKVVVFVLLEEAVPLEKAYRLACEEVHETVRELRRPLPPVSEEASLSLSGLESNLSKEAFEEAVRKAKDHIVSGDVIQVVLSQKFSGKVAGEAFELYRNLRAVNPSPYMFYLNFEEVTLIGSSPEILVRLEDDKIALRPIAGTRPRGLSMDEDQRLEKELLEDPKERAEHVMLVDLGRNDVGKAASPGSVTVPRIMDVERYSHVMHIVSRVEGCLKPDSDVFDLFVAAFPAGTVTGAPKIRAMEIIAELEPSPRGPYAGAVGYFGFNGNMDFCITIRTISIVRDTLSIQVGAGIVYDSSPEREYEETMNKAAAMFKAIEGVEKT